MKVAYTINGLIGGLSGKSWSRKDEDFLSTMVRYLYKSLNTHILKDNDVDIFLFSWHMNDADLFKEVYQPKKSLFIEQIKFDLPDHLSGPSNRDRIQAHYSRWYGLQEVMKLRREYEKEKNIEYDLVVNARFDHYWNKDINFSDLDTEKVHLSKFLDRAYGWSTGVCNNELLGDIFIMKPYYMDQFADMFNYLNDYTKPGECPSWKSISHHMLTVWHLRKLGLLKHDTIEFPLKTCFPIGTGGGQSLAVHPDRKEVNYTLLRYKVEMENLTREDIINDIT
jgi:hypothetical protein